MKNMSKATGAKVVASLIALGILGFVVGVVRSGHDDASARGSGPVSLRQGQIEVREAEVLEGGRGWALTSDGFWRTADAGGHWTSIEPPGVPAGAIESAGFADAEHGIAVVGEEYAPEEVRPVIYTTVDGGSTWGSRQLPERPALATASISFSEGGKEVHVLVTGPSAGGRPGNSNLYVSTDGGGEWESVGETPEAGYITFQSAEDGWLAADSGTDGEGLFRTTDGGRSWQVMSVDTPQGVGEFGTSYSLPSIAADGTGVLPVTFNGGVGHTAVGVYVTSDSGEDWALSRLVPLQGSIAPGGEPANVSIVGPEALTISDPGQPGLTEVNLEEGVFETAEAVEQTKAAPAAAPSLEAETEVEAVSTEHLPVGVNPIEFGENEEVAFAVEDATRCAGGDECAVPNALLVSRDGGVSWTPVTPP